jgi:hypothetical protein
MSKKFQDPCPALSSASNTESVGLTILQIHDLLKDPVMQ